MYLEAIMVCVNYADFLSITLPFNTQHFENIVIVTDKDDKKTQKICHQYKATCVITDRLYENGAKFNKGKAINDGISAASCSGWVIITDADMMMPKNLREELESRSLETNNVYGTSRLICPSHKDWLKYLKDENIYKSWKHQKRRINIGVGFFQLVHGSLLETHKYSEKYSHCGRSDRKFWRSFPPECRKKLKGIVPVHLGDDDLGANWHGRSTPEWQI